MYQLFIFITVFIVGLIIVIYYSIPWDCYNKLKVIEFFNCSTDNYSNSALFNCSNNKKECLERLYKEMYG